MTQILPTGDTFDAGSPAYDSGFLLGYMRARPVTNDPAFLSGGSGYGLAPTVWSTTHWLYSGWGLSGTGGSGSSNPTPAANTSPGALTTFPGGWIYRAFADDDVEVSMSWQTQADSTSILTVDRRTHVGIGARLSGSTLTNGGTTAAFHDGGSGYWGVLLYDPLLGGRFQIWRVVAGSIALLAQSLTALSWSDITATSQRSMTLKVNGTGASVTIELWTASSTRFPQAVVLTAIDSAVSRITGSGRAGFFASGEFQSSGIKAAPCINWFQALPTGGTPVVRDEWQRLNLFACRALSSSTSLFQGRAFVSCWYGDLFAVNSIASVLAVSSNRLTVGANHDISLLCQRLADDPIRQDRRCTFKFAAGTLVPNPSIRALGIVARGAAVASGQALDSGYLLEVRWNDQAGTASMHLARVVGGIETEIAALDPLSGIVLGTDFDLRLVVDNTAIPDITTGDVVLKAYVGASQIAMVGVGAPGVSVNGVGTVKDSSTFRVLSGLGEGVHVTNPTGSLRPLELDTWTLGGAIIASDLSVLDMVSVAISSESDGVTGTLVLPYNIGADEENVGQGVVHELDSDHSWRGTVGDNRFRRVWNLKLSGASTDELTTFRDFFDDHNGLAIPFNWTPPGANEAEIVGRFWTDAPEDALLAPHVAEFSYKILECMS